MLHVKLAVPTRVDEGDYGALISSEIHVAWLAFGWRQRSTRLDVCAFSPSR